MTNYGENSGAVVQRSEEIGLLEYLAKAFPAIAVLVVVTFLAHGSILFVERIGIDTEKIMYGYADFLNMGRQGLVWLAKILGTGTAVISDTNGAVAENNVLWTGPAGAVLNFNPYLVQVLTFAFMAATPVAFGFLFCRYSGQKMAINMTLIVFGVSYIVSPFWVSQIYFFNQSAQVTLACLLTAVAIYLAEEGRRAFLRKGYFILLSILLMQFTFSSYQVLIMIYVVGVIMVFLCSDLGEPKNFIRQILWILPHLATFFTGFLIYWVVTKRYFYSMEDYLKQQLVWEDGFDFKKVVDQCLPAVREALGKNPPYFTGFFGAFALFCLIAVLYVNLRNMRFRWRVVAGLVFFLAVCVLIVSAFSFILFFGGETPPRVQLVLPFVQGCLLYLGVEFLFGVEQRDPLIEKILRKGVVILLAAAILKNTITDMGTCNRMYYRDEWRYQYDKQMAHDIYVGLQEYLAENGYDSSYLKYLLFLGYPEPPYNPAAQMNLRDDDVVGRSIFSYDVERADDIRRPRILDFMKILGYPIDPEPEFYGGSAARICYIYFGAETGFADRVDNMPVFPAKGSIRLLEAVPKSGGDKLRYLVVKLAPDWKEDFLFRRALWLASDPNWVDVPF